MAPLTPAHRFQQIYKKLLQSLPTAHRLSLGHVQTYQAYYVLSILNVVIIGGPGSLQNPTQLQGATIIGLKGTNSPCTPIVTISGSYPQISTHDCTQGEHDTNWKYNQSVGVLVGKH